MSRPTNVSLRLSGALKVAQGDFADVVLVGEAKVGYEALEQRTDTLNVQQKTHLKRYMDRYCEGHRLSDKMYKPQGRVRDGNGNEHLIHEFKAFKYRVYGVVMDCSGKRTFVGTAVNPKKDKDKADPGDLKRASAAASRIVDDLQK